MAVVVRDVILWSPHIVVLLKEGEVEVDMLTLSLQDLHLAVSWGLMSSSLYLIKIAGEARFSPYY